MTYLENSPSLNPLNYKASVKMAGSLLFKGVVSSMCCALELTNPTMVAQQVCDEFGCPLLKRGHLTDSLGRIQEANFITEQQMYFVMSSSRKPNAKPFRMWVNTEVLPSIRKTGSYSVVKSPIERILANSVDQLEAVEAIKEVKFSS